jgi:pimeloyl-ACP methyl ester carboxylesterase
MKLMMMKTYIGLSSILNPERAAKKSFDLFQKVRKKDVREREVPFYQEVRRFKVDSEGEPINCFELGDPNGPLLLLVHGWDSNAGSMSMFAGKFAEMGYRVIAFNLPGHAFYTSAKTNLLECKNAMIDVLNFLNINEPISVVSHSFGSAVVANSLAETGHEVDRMVFLTNPNRMEDIFKEFKKMIGLTHRAYRFMVRNTSEMLGGPIDMLDVSANLKKVDFDKLLLIHDLDDKVLSFTNSFDINSEHQNVQLIRMEKIGHYKMLWNDEVIGRTTSFIAGKEVY